MRSMRSLIIVALITVVTGLIVMLPARVVYRWVVPPEIAIGGIDGTAWTGSANEAEVSGFYLRNIKWRINPWQLFAGKFSYQVKATPVSGFLEAQVNISFGGELSLAELKAALPLELFAGASGVRGLQGSASLEFERVVFADGFIVAADGTLGVANLIVPLVGRDSLGGYKAEFFTQNNGIAASIEDTDGVIDLAGSLQIKSDRTFRFLGQVVAKPDTPESILQQMKFLPPANDRGQQEVRLEGVL